MDNPEQFLSRSLSESGIAPEIIKRRGYRAVHAKDWTLLGQGEGIYKNQWGPGFWIPIFSPESPNGTALPAGQLRLIDPQPWTDSAGKEHAPHKYLTAAGKPSLIDMLHYKADAKQVFIVEGIKQTDAIASIQPGLSLLAIQGCYGWKTKDKDTLRPELIALCEGKSVRGLFDSDFRTNPDVREAARRFLRACKATVSIGPSKLISFPSDPTHPTMGVDDWLASGGQWNEIQEHASVSVSSRSSRSPQDPSKQAQRKDDDKHQLKMLVSHAALSDAAMAAYLLEETSLPAHVRVLSSGSVWSFNASLRLWREQTGTKRMGVIGWYINQYLPSYLERHFASALSAARQNHNGALVDQLLEVQADQHRLLGQHARRMAIAQEVFQRSDLDAVPDSLTGQAALLPLPGGKVWDLRLFDADAPRATYERDRLPEDNFTWQMACVPQSGPTDVFDRTIGRTLGAEATEALLDCMGYILQGGRASNRAVLFRGIGRQGKSLLASEVLGERIIGDGGWMECARDYFFGYKDRHDHHLHDHLGKRLITVTDPSGPMRETEFLSYTGGGGTISAEKKGGGMVRFKPTACLLINGQDERLKIDGSDVATRDRLWTLSFPPIPEDQRDDDLLRKLEPEVPALAWQVVLRAACYVQDGVISNASFLCATTGALAHEHDPVAQFCEECLQTDFESMDSEGRLSSWVSGSHLWDVWQEWCESNGVALHKSRQWFSTQLRKRYPSLVHDRRVLDGKRARCWYGICLHPDSEV